MNQNTVRMLATFAVAAGLSGCCDYCYHDLVDPCYPQRYICQARQQVYAPLAAQANNGLVLEQTLWNHHFVTVKEGDKTKTVLSPAGKARLDYLVRRRPGPVPEVFVQTAHDLPFDPEKPQEFASQRMEMDSQRVKAVSDYLAAVRPDVAFRVTVHDPHPVGLQGNEVVNAVTHMQQTSQGAMPSESFGDGVPINGITGTGADPTGRGLISVQGAGAPRLNITNTPAGMAGAAGTGAAAPAAPAQPASSGGASQP
jgi:hypothetical protein